MTPQLHPESAPAPPPVPKPLSEAARLTGVFFSPKSTFPDIARRPRWWIPIILLAIIFFLMGLQGLIGWALSGSALGAVVGGIGGLVMIVFTVGFLYPLKILVSFLQAFIFVMLTMLYISGAIEEAEHHGGEHQPAHH